MATCNTETLLADGRSFQGLSNKYLKMVQAQMLSTWAASLNPELDYAPTAVYARASCFQCLSEKALKVATAQLLCDIKQAIAVS